LVQKQRTIVEELFKEDKIKILSSTPTLAAGVNLPASVVIIPSIYRFARFGMEPISVREYKQQAGRAGRPKYREEGTAIILAKTELEKEELLEDYVNGNLEEITSKLGIEPILRMHLLSLIATRFITDLASMEDFFSKTFYAKQYQELDELFGKLSGLLKELKEMQFIETTDKAFKATLLGKRVAELFIDPITAHTFIQALKGNKIGTELSYLFLLCDSFELYPYPTVPAAKESLFWAELAEAKKQLFCDLDKKMYEDQEIVGKYFLTKTFLEWINETNEEVLMKDFKMQPGILRQKLQMLDWLVYALLELEKTLGLKVHFGALNNLRIRTKYGIREELLVLVQLKGIGRVRARQLFRNDFKILADLKNAELTKLAQILGQKIALSVKQQLGQEKDTVLKEIVQSQTSLDKF
ncbi:MAG: helicase-related protein, partial [Candidatus Diapherotrites archaeon]|nr:helicase-related protein [Candidatus Diapherotrites archaeon]